MRRLALFLGVLLLPLSVRAAGDECQGREIDVSTDDALDMAIDDAQPGDRIVVHEAEQPYAELQKSPPSGVSEAPICLVGAEGESPVFGGQIKLNGASYWILEGLTLAGGSSRGFEIRSQTTSTVGVVIRNNRIIDVPGPAIKSGVPFGTPGDAEHDAAPTIGTRIENNYVYGSASTGIEITNGSGVVVRDNVVEAVRCEATQQKGVLISGATEDITVEGNAIRMAEDCDSPNGVLISGIELRGAGVTTVSRNLVEVGGNPAAADIRGIMVWRGTVDAELTDNIVRVPVGCGLCEALDTGDTAGSLWARNTVVGTEIGISVLGTDARFESNLVLADALAVRLDAEAVPAGVSLAGNLFHAPDDAAFELDGTAADLAAWASDCDCDQASVFETPTLAPDGLTPAGDSVDNAVSSSRVAIAGARADVGALEAPLLLGLEVSDDGSTVTASFDVANPPLSPSGCEGVQVGRNGALVAVESCSFGDDALVLTLAEPLYRDDDATFQVVALYDQSNVGGVGAMVHSDPIDLDIAALPEAPQDGTTGGDATGSDTGDTDAARTPPPDTGCGCRSDGGTGWAFLVFLLAGFSRRSIRRS